MTTEGLKAEREVFILLNGPFAKPRDLPKAPPSGALVVAVDGGAVHVLAIGWPVDILLGDFDSLPSKVMDILKKRHPFLKIETFPKDKDETDFELALRLLDPMSETFSKITILGGLGGRWDMTLANLLSPLASNLKLLTGSGGSEVVFREGDWSLHLISGPGSLRLSASPEPRRVSLIPIRGEAMGASLTGDFKYPLSGGTLAENLTRGLSNELGPSGGAISIESGTLIITVSPLADEGFVRPEPNLKA